MLGYEKVNMKINEVLNPYKKSSESCKISGIIDCNNKFYREVIFYKRKFLKFKLEVNGYLYLDAENKVINDKSLLKDLFKLGFYYDIFFNDDEAAGILSTLKTEVEVQKEKDIIKEIGEALDYLLKQKVYAAERVKTALIKIFNLKEKSNLILKELSNIIVDVKQQDFKFNEELYNKLYTYYEDILKVNFEKIILMASLEDCIDEVIKEAEKKRKKLDARIISNMVGKLIKLSDELSYYKRLMVIYRDVIHMNTNQYVKYLNNLDKERIENRNNLIRY